MVSLLVKIGLRVMSSVCSWIIWDGVHLSAAV